MGHGGKIVLNDFILYSTIFDQSIGKIIDLLFGWLINLRERERKKGTRFNVLTLMPKDNHNAFYRQTLKFGLSKSGRVCISHETEKKVLQTNPKLANSRLDRILEITEIAATMEARGKCIHSLGLCLCSLIDTEALA